MTMSYKPLLLSALVFPGSGYFLLKKNIRGAVSALITLSVVVILIKEALYKSELITDRIINGQLALDIDAIRLAILNTPGNISPGTLSAITWVLVIVWLCSIVDCYRLSKLQAKQMAPATSTD